MCIKYHIFFIHSLFEEHLGCFHVLAIYFQILSVSHVVNNDQITETLPVPHEAYLLALKVDHWGMLNSKFTA